MYSGTSLGKTTRGILGGYPGRVLSIEMSPYEALYEKQCRTPLCWNETGKRKLLGPEIVQTKVDKVNVIRARLKATQNR